MSEWTIERPPDVTPDGSLDLAGEGMVIRSPAGQRYEVITPDLVPVHTPPPSGEDAPTRA